MPALDSATAPAAAAHGDIKAAHHGAPYDLFLVLRCGVLDLYAASATRAARGQRDVERFIDARRDGAAGASAVSAAGFPAWELGVRFQFPARMWCRLSLARPQRCFQFLAEPLDLLLQAVAFLLQALTFPLQALTFPLPSLVLLLQPFDLPLGSVELLLGD
jgi:hypothetical protein